MGAVEIFIPYIGADGGINPRYPGAEHLHRGPAVKIELLQHSR